MRLRDRKNLGPADRKTIKDEEYKKLRKLLGHEVSETRKLAGA